MIRLMLNVTSRTRGFTLIELLVVIAIIGILASVVLASLNSARDKGADAAIKSNLTNTRAQAELFYDSNSNTYANVCTSGTNNISAMRTGATTAGSADVDCASDANEWAISAQLKSNTAQYFCVDYKGVGTTTTAAIVAGIAAATNGDMDCD